MISCDSRKRNVHIEGEHSISGADGPKVRSRRFFSTCVCNVLIQDRFRNI